MLQCYMVTGGVPFYLDQIDHSDSLLYRCLPLIDTVLVYSMCEIKKTWVVCIRCLSRGPRMPTQSKQATQNPTPRRICKH